MSAISTRLAVLGLIVGLVAVTVTPVSAGSRPASEARATGDVALEFARGVLGAHEGCGPQVSDASNDVYAPTGESVDLTIPVCGAR